MKKAIFFSIILILMVQFALAESGYPNFWRGNVYIDGSLAPAGTRVDSIKSGIIIDTCYTGIDCIMANPSLNMYEVGALGVKGEQVQLVVWGVPATQSPQFHTGTYDLILLDINMNTLANGQACTYDDSCSSGICLHNVCRATNPFCGDGFADGSEQCDGGTGCTSSCTFSSNGGGGGGSGGGGSPSIKPTCTANLSCGSWGECLSSGVQTRTCKDLNNCTIVPIVETKNCTFLPEAVGEWKSPSESGMSVGGGLYNQTGGNETAAPGNLLTGLIFWKGDMQPSKWMPWLLLLLIILLIWAYRRYTREE